MNRLALKLQATGELSDEDRRLLDEIVRNVREVPARTDLITEGDRPDNVHLVLDGFACRYKLTESGERHIVAYLVPGDFCDLHVAILGEMDHSIATLSHSRTVEIPQNEVDRMLHRPGLAKALWWSTLVDEAVLREWLVNMGTRDAARSLAHLFSELLVRLRAVGLAEGNSYEFPVTQEELAQTAGLSTVHVNRSLQTLRAEGLLEFECKRATVRDPARLFECCGFNPNYLHLGGGGNAARRPHRSRVNGEQSLSTGSGRA
jgi:CRP-like cAMP-binding protein